MAKKVKYDQATLDEAMKPTMPRLKEQFKNEVCPKLASEFGISNLMQMQSLRRSRSMSMLVVISMAPRFQPTFVTLLFTL